MKKNIAFFGYKFSGKDTAADYLIDKKNYIKLSFATPLKNLCSEIFGFTQDQLNKPNLKEIIDEYWGFSPRTALQVIGTNLFRNNIHHFLPINENELWIKSFLYQYKKKIIENPNQKIIITDLRFENESIILKNLGFILIKIENENLSKNIDLHESETNIGNFF